MEEYFSRAIANVVKYGDTDVLPFPIENHVFHDCRTETINLLHSLHSDFEQWLTNYPPSNEGALAPVSYTGFRWATQIDPLWNLYFLALVLSISEKIENARISTDQNCVFSYRYKWDEEGATIFDTNFNWRSFMEHSQILAKNHKFVVICDISEFYPRLGHHRIENALSHLNLKTDIPSRLLKFLSNFSNTNSFGLPVGGPAARILSELTLNQIDQLLRLDGVAFCRFSDDFHLFADSMEDGFAKLLTLTEKLQRTQGLQLQKSKTKILTAAEFLATSPLRINDHDAPDEATPDTSLESKARGLLRFSLRFDPYSATATDDYEELKGEIEKFDIVALLQAELAKSRVHIALARKVVTAIRYLDSKPRDNAVLSLINNSELLYPIFPSILMVIRQIFDELHESTRASVVQALLEMIRQGSHVLRVDMVLAYAIRVLALAPSAGVEEVLVQLHRRTHLSALVRRDIILAMTRLHAWHWLSDLRTTFRSMSPAERRAYIVASYSLKDEGKHWRQHIAGEWSPMEKMMRDWVAEKVGQPNWIVPL